MKRLPFLAGLFFLLASPARAEEPYAPLLRDLDKAGLLETLVARSIATTWGSIEVLVPEEKRGKLIDPLLAVSRKNLSRPEAIALADDLLTLHEQGAIVPLISEGLGALDNPGPAEKSLGAISRLPRAAVKASPKQLASLLLEGVSNAAPEALAGISKTSSELPEETWAALGAILKEVASGEFPEKLSEFLHRGKKMGVGLERSRELLPAALCSLEPQMLERTRAGARYIAEYAGNHPDPALLVSFVQWVLAQLSDSKQQAVISGVLAYPRMRELLAATRLGIERGVLGEVFLDYADFLADKDERLRMDPELWKKVKAGEISGDEEEKARSSGLSASQFVRLGALTLFTIERLDEVPAPPYPGRPKQTLGDEALDFSDHQLSVLGRRSALSPLFDALREFLRPEPERAIFLSFVRDFSKYAVSHDPASWLLAFAAQIECDPEGKAPKLLSEFLDEKSDNGDLRSILSSLAPLAKHPVAPLAPLAKKLSAFEENGTKLAPAARAILLEEKKTSAGSKFLAALGEEEIPEDMAPLFVGLASRPAFLRSQAALATADRSRLSLDFAKAFLSKPKKGNSDFEEIVKALSVWSRYKSPVSGRPLPVDTELVLLESFRSGLVESLLDAGVHVRKIRGPKATADLLATIRKLLAEPSPATKSLGRKDG
ncbi:MAG: hypothetical protein AB1405_12645, partial [Bdellovibrionota bacterium]